MKTSLSVPTDFFVCVAATIALVRYAFLG